MDKLMKLTNNELFQMLFGEKAFRVYRKEVDGRLGMPGLSKLVLKATGNALKEEEAYVFAIKNRNAVKILTIEQGNASILEVLDMNAKGIKDEFIQLGLVQV